MDCPKSNFGRRILRTTPSLLLWRALTPLLDTVDLSLNAFRISVASLEDMCFFRQGDGLNRALRSLAFRIATFDCKLLKVGRGGKAHTPTLFSFTKKMTRFTKGGLHPY